MPVVNIDVDVELSQALKGVDYDDLITYLLECAQTDRIIDHLGEDEMLARIDNDSIAEYACDNCEVVPRENI